ncbi:cell envelope integrity protein TolA [Rhizobacter sp. AJA081-3]|uniref:cell envelope integrity protein TolA n=1 Tax=Rhizobacter sp. AJA081-3 TaxID=2753607 RepID=UPI001ADF1144|nr:cell envelope integrity protein TolA [Rhizobacter sp. AJA081-3]QTN21271.1 cell envelope integrity protein TolA [Rhizobacter sp. AJA081-3]
MTAATLTRDALIPRNPDGLGRGLGLALLAHALLLVALAFSVNWRSSNPAGVEAELWAAVPQIAAPRAVEPEPTPQPQPKKVEPPPPPPKVEPVQKVPDAQIAIEKAKREEEKRKEEARREEQQRQKDEALRKQAELDKKKKEAAEQQKRAVAEAAAAEKRREDQLKRLAGIAGATGEPNSTGTAARTAGPSATYAGRIKARIMPNIVFGDTITGNPQATVEVKAGPDGTIIGRRLLKSSGVPAWDEAVLRAIDKTEVLPRDTDGRVPPAFEISFRPHE